MQHVQFSIIKCSFYAKNEIYRRGYTSFSYNFIHFVCMFYTIPAIYEIVQVVYVIRKYILNKDCMACVRVERNFLPVLYTTRKGNGPKFPMCCMHLIGELMSMAFKHHMTI